MLSEIPTEEFNQALDECVEAALAEAGVSHPPMDALLVAKRLGLVIARDNRLAGRARFVRLALQSGRSLGTILVGKTDRPERQQWAVAHELGEFLAKNVFFSLGVHPNEAPSAAREKIANLLANRILLPTSLFRKAGADCEWNLFCLKEQFSTASHELIARRMLDMPPPVILTVYDQGKITWRRSNALSSVPPLSAEETTLWKRTYANGIAGEKLSSLPEHLLSIRCWPVHEADWKREIIRSELIEE